MHVSRHETHALDRPLARWKFERNLEKVDSIALASPAPLRSGHQDADTPT